MCGKVRFFLLSLILSVLFLTASAPVSADSFWPPKFVPGQTVYVDPALLNNPQSREPLNGLATELANQAKRHNVQFYVVATERPQSPGAAVPLSNELFTFWANQPGFSRKDSVLIVWVRWAGDPAHGSVAAFPGSAIQGDRSLTPDKLNDPNGPVRKDLARYMGSDPAAGLAKVASNINDYVDNQIAVAAEQKRQEELRAAQQKRQAEEEAARQKRLAEEKEAQRLAAEKARKQAEEDARRRAEAFRQAAPYLTGAGIVFLLLFGVGALYVRWSRMRAQAFKSIEDWRRMFTHANSNYIQLQTEYMPFLQAQGTDWKTRFQGKTLAVYTDACAKFSDLSVRMSVANELLDTATAAAQSSSFPSVAGFRKAIATLESTPVTVTGELLPTNLISLFKDIIDSKTYVPGDLLKEMDALFTQSNSALASIMAALQGAEQNRQDIDRLKKKIDGLREQLIAKSLTFTPYESSFAAVSAGQDTFMAKLASDPLSAFAESEAVENSAEKLAAHLQRAMEVKEAELKVATIIEQSEQKVAAQRQKQILADLPLPGVNSRDKQESNPERTQTLKLLEDGGNPDPEFKAAREYLLTARQLLLEGKIEQALATHKTSLSCSTRAEAVVEEVLAAMSFVRQNLPALYDSLEKLQGELPAAGKARADLLEYFLEKNYGSEPANYKTAQTINDNSQANMDKLRKAFQEQSFLQARKELTTLSDSVKQARTLLSGIHSRLKQLNELRAHSRSTIQTASQRAGELRTKLSQHSFTTAAFTDQAFSRLSTYLNHMKEEVNKAKTDWVTAAGEADTLLNGLNKINQDIDTDKQAFEQAGNSAHALQSAITAASQAVNHKDCRGAARTKLNEANQGLGQVTLTLRTPKSDWKALIQRTNAITNTANQAKEMGLKDQELAANARSLISKASGNIQSSNRSYAANASYRGHSQHCGSNVRADLGKANNHLAQARSYLDDQEYEKSISSSQSAHRAAEQAEREAQAAVAALVAAAIAVWQAEERRRREEEDRQRREEEDRRRREEERRRQEDDDRRRASYSSSYDSSSSYGSSYSSGGGGSDYSSGGGGGSYSSGGGGGDY